MLRSGAATLGGLALIVAIAPSASADGETGASGCASMRVCVEVDIPEKPGGSTGPGPSGNGNGNGSSKSDPLIDGTSCEIRRLKPQPPAGSALWEGHEPGDGAVYVNTCAGGLGTANIDTIGGAFWSKSAPAPAVDPAVLARRAVDSMLLEGPVVASPRPEGQYTVGVPMWLWVSQSPTTWGPNTASASAGGITVTATAKVSSVMWDMGDGARITCSGPGTPYTPGRGMTPSPDCGHLYRATSAGQTGSAYKGTATSTWTVDWMVTGGGRTGQLTEVRQSAFTVSVGEVQVVGQ
ncbi:ATP/GTP-binding protein [Streptomyces subrutilus]|uniref:ATP/GTP-binding protein n=1 Tax=Streptomyces subrutilus TaxID=36818 RepID=A0A1E5PKB4_9ACTN|nr:ATP/GTP-binding protein [Streptomyces subrutilus]